MNDSSRGGANDVPQLRRSRRQLDNDEDEESKVQDTGYDDIVEDEETTRCICGQQDYPGLPNDLAGTRGAKNGHLENQDDQSDDRGGLFIQCDQCQVWQHGGCVSILEESAVPDNYFCEECKPSWHELLKSSNGQQFSHYLPVWKPAAKSHRKGSVEKDDRPKTTKEKERLSRALPETKRRSTMNSRSAYDEEEVLRKVLEESKTEGLGPENGHRKGKRGRDDSEDVRFDIKRQRTESSVISSHSVSEESQQESDNERANKKLLRHATAKSAKENARSKSEAAAAAAAPTGRKGRADRRRTGGGDAVPAESEDGADANSPSAADKLDTKQEGSSGSKDSPIASKANSPDATPVASTVPTHSKRGGRRPGAGRGKSNQAPTPVNEREDGKDTPHNGGSSNNDHPNPTPTPQPTHPASTNGGSKRSKRLTHTQNSTSTNTESADTSDKDNPQISINGVGNSDSEKQNAEKGALGKRKEGKEPSMNELKRRAAAMLEWLERAKEEMGRRALISMNTASSSTSKAISPAGMNGIASGAIDGGLVMGSGAVVSNGGSVSVSVVKEETTVPGGVGTVVAESLEQRLVGWQVEFAGGG